MATTRVGGASFSADGSRMLFHSNASGVSNTFAMPVECIVFPDQRHRFSEGSNEMKANRTMHEFLDRHLMKLRSTYGNRVRQRRDP